MDTTKSSRPTWWKDEHGDRWERAKEALRRDWDQTKHDLHLGGHELNQEFEDTMRQAKGDFIPPIDEANGPKILKDVSLDWQRVEEPMRYGYGARAQYGGVYPRWTDELEGKLRAEWTGLGGPRLRWEKVRSVVRHGYEYESRPHKA